MFRFVYRMNLFLNKVVFFLSCKADDLAFNRLLKQLYVELVVQSHLKTDRSCELLETFFLVNRLLFKTVVHLRRANTVSIVDDRLLHFSLKGVHDTDWVQSGVNFNQQTELEHA